MARALAHHWPEYLMEALGLSLYMLLACLVTVAVQHPGLTVRGVVGSSLLRRAMIGMAMGLTAMGLIYSPWGQRSGAHLNPSVTLAFWRLGKVAAWDAVFYILAQFAGGLAGVLVAASVLRQWLGDPAVNYAVTRPGLLGRRGLRGRTVDLTRLHDRRSAHVQRGAAGPPHRTCRRRAASDLHHRRNPAEWHEHEPGPESGLSGAGRLLDGALGLLHGPGAGHAPGRRGLSARQGRGSRGLRQARSSRRIPMHLSLRVPGMTTVRDANQGEAEHLLSRARRRKNES